MAVYTKTKCIFKLKACSDCV